MHRICAQVCTVYNLRIIKGKYNSEIYIHGSIGLSFSLIGLLLGYLSKILIIKFIEANIRDFQFLAIIDLEGTISKIGTYQVTQVIDA